MDPANIEVRRHLREVETYRELSNWQMITPEKHAEINDHLAGLPTAFREDEHGEEAKRFDYLVLRLQLAYLNADPGYMSFRAQVQEIASAPVGRDHAEHPGSQRPAGAAGGSSGR